MRMSPYPGESLEMGPPLVAGANSILSKAGQYPVNSAVIVFRRQDWIGLLGKIYSLSHATVDKALTDLTFGVTKTRDLFVHPFVPIDERFELLVLAPQFPLKSRPDENIIRVCSHLRPKLHDALTKAKESEMRSELETKARPGSRLGGPRSLPEGLLTLM
jgi:hypothetical protein